MAGKGSSQKESEEDPEEIALTNQLQELQSRSSGMQQMFQEMTSDQQNSLNELMELKRQRDLLIEQLNRQEQLRAARGHQLAVRKLHSQDEQVYSEPRETGAAADSHQRRGMGGSTSTSSTGSAKHEDLVRVDATLEELRQYIRLGQEMVNTVESGPITTELDQSISLVKEVIDRFNELKSSFITMREAISEFVNANQAKGDKYDSVLTFRDELETNFDAAKRCFVSTSKLLQLAVDRRRDWIMSAGTSSAPSTSSSTVRMSLGPSGDASASALTALKNAGTGSTSVTATSKTLWSSLPVATNQEGPPSDAPCMTVSLPLMNDSASEDESSRRGRDRDENRPERDEDNAMQVSQASGRNLENQQHAMMSNLARDLTNWSNELAKLREIYQQTESGNSLPVSSNQQSKPEELQGEDEEDEDDNEEEEELTEEDRAVIAQAERDRARLAKLREQRSKEEKEIKALLEQRNQLARKLQAVQQAKAIATAASESLVVGSGDGTVSTTDRMQTMESQNSLLRSLQEQLRLSDMSSPLSFHNDISASGTNDNAAKDDSNGGYRGRDDDEEDEEEEDSDQDHGEEDDDDVSMSLQAAMSAGRQSSNMNNTKPLNPDLAMLPELEARVREMADKKRELNRLKTLLCMLRSSEQDLETPTGSASASASTANPPATATNDNAANMWRDDDDDEPDGRRNSLDQRGQKMRDSVTFQEPIATFIANDELYENMREARMWREQLRDQQQSGSHQHGHAVSPDRAQVMKQGRGLLPGQNGAPVLSSNMETASQDRTTLATWGGSSSAGDLDLGTASSNMSDVVREDDQPRRVTPNLVGERSSSGNSVSHLESRIEQLQNQLNSVLGMCNTLMVEQSRLSAHILTQSSNNSAGSNAAAAPSPVSPAVSASASLMLHERHSDHSDLAGCMAKMAHLQAHMWQVQQQLQMMNNYMGYMHALPPPISPHMQNPNQQSVSGMPGMFMPTQIPQPYRYPSTVQFGQGQTPYYNNEWMMNGGDHANKNSSNRRMAAHNRRNGSDGRNDSPMFNENGGLSSRHGWGPDSPSID